MLKAPRGGLVSTVNGEEYTGGQFMPITGEFCGEGRNRVSVARLAEINAALIPKNQRVEWCASSKAFKWKMTVKLSNGTKTEQTFCSVKSLKSFKI